MATNPIQKIFVIGFIILAVANVLVSLLTIIIKTQKYGAADTWQNPDSFAIGTLILGIICCGIAYWFYRKKI